MRTQEETLDNYLQLLKIVLKLNKCFVGYDDKPHGSDIFSFRTNIDTSSINAEHILTQKCIIPDGVILKEMSFIPKVELFPLDLRIFGNFNLGYNGMEYFSTTWDDWHSIPNQLLFELDCSFPGEGNGVNFITNPYSYTGILSNSIADCETIEGMIHHTIEMTFRLINNGRSYYFDDFECVSKYDVIKKSDVVINPTLLATAFNEWIELNELIGLSNYKTFKG